MSEVLIRLYQNHGNSIGYWEGWVEPSGVVVIRYAKKLDGKPVEKSYQASAKNIGKSNETTPYQQGVLELESKARLKLDKGYVNTLEEAKAPSTNSLGLEKPMLATPLEQVKESKIDWSNAFNQPKLDGHRALFKQGTLYSRQGKVLNLPHIVEAVKNAGIDTLHTDGELYIHGKTLQELSKLIKKHRPESLDIQYHIYDIVSDKPFRERTKILSDSAYNWPQNTKLRLVPTVAVGSLDQLMDDHKQYRSGGFEGTMLRFGNEGYKDGKRSRTLLKVKDFQDEEFEIVDVKEGKPYKSTDGSIYRVPIWVCRVGNGEIFDVTAQGDMYEKDVQWHKRKYCIGKKLTVKFHYYSDKGIPQLPIALRFYETV